MRVLISIAPRLYRELLALALKERDPCLEVRVAAPQDLGRQARSFAPHLLLRTREAPVEQTHATSWVELNFNDGPVHATVYIEGRHSEIEDAGINDLSAIIDETRRSIS